MVHEMMLNPEPFRSIYDGIKTAEYRLYDEKRQKINVGDTIKFTNTESGETLSVAVTGIDIYPDFFALFSKRGGKECGYGHWTPKQLADSMTEYYTEEQQKKYGTVAIEIKLIGPALKIIGRIKNDFPTKFGLPRQAGLVENIKGYIEFLPEYRVKEAFRGLEGYSHLWIIWGFSHAERADWSPTVRPPRLGGNKRMGVFATRSPFRPNSLGMSSVKIDRIDTENCRIYFDGGDMCDGTPVYDVKPYLGFTDSHPDSIDGFAGEKKGYSVKVEISEELKKKIPQDKLEGLMGILENDPRPAYKEDGEKEYGFLYGEHEIKFVCKNGILEVIAIE